MVNVFHNIGSGETQISSSNGTMVIPLPPFSINNMGYYDISDLNVTTQIEDSRGSLISTSTTFVSSIPATAMVKNAHNITINVKDLPAKDLTYLFFNDSVLNVNTFIALKFNYVIPLQVSTEGTTPWGAPLNNFSIGKISYRFHNLTCYKVVIPVSFENHSSFSVDGAIRFEVYNVRNDCVGFGTTDVHVSPYTSFKCQKELTVRSDPKEIAELRIYFDTSMFSFGPQVVHIG